jgi:Holliday junction resolvase RusA-like endonuclease
MTPALASAPPAAPAAPRAVDVPRLVLRLAGQVRGGKNAMGVTKSGMHYAKAPFKKWRAEMMAQINAQGCGGILISTPTNVRIDYVAGDRKQRDQTGIFDALFHLLEHAQIVIDDSLLWVTQSSRSYAKDAPGVTITFLD